MSTKYASTIKKLRRKGGFSQLSVAKKLGLSRHQYMAVERGNRELSLDEAEKICDIFGISMPSLTKATEPNYEKYKQMILALLSTPVSEDGKIPKTKLAKLLYLSDFAWFYENLESMSGMQYLRREYGPVPDPYFRALAELEDEGKIKIDHKGDAMLIFLGAGAVHEKLNLMDEKEIELMRKISLKWKDKRTPEIVSFTHQQLPYKLCSPDEVIPYGLITQEDPQHVY
ncbi:MAG: helix-turn-helix domain-containing protein [Candidatus Komeilibacteria bacterium]|nr:helix-turn-helix domain-containing protein [Candidatus Komeilibacteria bacterium]